MIKKPIVIMNWSMRQNNVKDATKFAKELVNHGAMNRNVDLVILPSMGTIYPVSRVVEGSLVAIGSQNIAPIAQGELSGEFSISSLKEIGGEYVELGHWERRKFFGETDVMINKKVKLSLANNINPIVCIGELEQKEADNVIDEIRDPNYEESLEQELFLKVVNNLYGLDVEDLKKVIIAYTPAWAVGQSRAASSLHIRRATDIIRKALNKIYGDSGNEVRIVYGGSVSPENSNSMIETANLDGVLLGRFGSDSTRLQKVVDIISDIKF